MTLVFSNKSDSDRVINVMYVAMGPIGHGCPLGEAVEKLDCPKIKINLHTVRSQDVDEEEMLEKLRESYLDIEDRLEGLEGKLD